MNELDIIRRFLRESPPPHPQVVSRAQRRLTELAESTEAGQAPTSTTTARGPLAGWVAALCVACALVCGVGAAVLLPFERNVQAGPSPAEAKPAPNILLTAAQASSTEKVTSGAYWKVRTVHTFPLSRTVGTDDNPYHLAERRIIERWTPRDGGSATAWYGVRSLGVHPASTADEVAWHRDGAPTTWDLGPLDSPGRPHRILALNRPGIGSLGKVSAEPASFALAEDIVLTHAQLQNLPTDPAGLRKYLLALKDRAGTALKDDQWLFVTASALVTDMPTPPLVRAATFRTLAALPGISNMGADYSSGRKGIRLALTSKSSAETVELVVDPASGTLLAKKVHGPKNRVTVVVSAGWTDERPRVPQVETVPLPEPSVVP